MSNYFLYKILFLLLYINIINNTLPIIPNSYLEYDEIFYNDIDHDLEKYHYILESSARQGYVDEHLGIYYSSDLRCCWYNYHFSDYDRTMSHTIFENIDITNNKNLYNKGCSCGNFQNSVVFQCYYENENIKYSTEIRYANPNNVNIAMDVGIITSLSSFLQNNNDTGYGSINPSRILVGINNINVKDSKILVKNYTIGRFKLKWDKNYYYLEEENFTIPHSYSMPTQFSLNFRNHEKEDYKYTIDSEEQTINTNYTNLIIISKLFTILMPDFTLSLKGNLFNWCTERFCTSSDRCSNNKCSNYYSGYYSSISTCGHKGCAPTSFCDTSTNICTQCTDLTCKRCSNKGYNNCISCFNTAIDKQWYYDYLDSTNFNDNQCTFEYNALNHFENFEFSIPIPYNYRITLEFWVFIHDTKYFLNPKLEPALSSFIIRDFMTVSIGKGIDSTINLYLIPFELFYPFPSSITSLTTFESNYKNRYSELQYVTDSYENISSQWVFMRVGLSYEHKKFYAGKNKKELEYIKIFNNKENTGTESNTYNSFLRKYYRINDRTTFRVQGFSYVDTDTYIKNLNIYNEYISTNINYPNYFDMHDFQNSIIYQQLFLVIPFNDVKINSQTRIANMSYFDYSNQFNTNNDIITNVITFDWISGSMKPSTNFKRLKLMKGQNNKYYDTTDLSSLSKNIDCTYPNRYCYDHNKSYVCDGNSLMEIFDDPETKEYYGTCKDSCIFEYSEEPSTTITEKYMALPNIKINKPNSNITSRYCNFLCNNDEVENCPTSKSDNIKNFKCKSEYTTLFYHCYKKEDLPPEEGVFQFSGTLNTKSIEFNINEISSFYIEMWFHPDILFQNNPPLKNSYLLLTDKHGIYFDVATQEFKLFINEITNNYPLQQNFYYYGWNHLIFQAKTSELNGETITTYSVSITNNFIEVKKLSGITPISKICFCNSDENCCSHFSNILWFDMFVRGIKVWDANFISENTILDYDKFSYIIPGGLNHVYDLTSTKINLNEITDDITKTLKANVFPNVYDKINPNFEQNYNFAWKFSWNDNNYPYYLKNAKLNDTDFKIIINEYGECSPECASCFGDNKYTCYKCKKGYALIGSTCTKTSDLKSFYYFMNPLKRNGNVPENYLELTLNIDDLNLANFPSLTLFFYMKIYGFTNERITEYTNNPVDKYKFEIIELNKDAGNSLKLSYDYTNKNLNLYFRDNILFQYNNFDEIIGKWIPISISIFTPPLITLQNPFESMTVNNEPLNYKPFEEDVNLNTYELISINTFKINKYVIGHFSEISFFKTFIVNGYGYAQHKDLPGSFVQNYLIKTIKLNFETEDFDNQILCVNLDEIVYSSGDNIEDYITCTPDYLTYTDQNCSDTQLVQITNQYLPPNCIDNASKCENIKQVIKLMSPNCEPLYSTCDNLSPNSLNNLIFKVSNENNKVFIECGNSLGLDLARFQSNSINDLTNPTDNFKMEFWFLSQSYIPINFGELEIEWESHLTIKVSFSGGYFQASCSSFSTNSLSFTYTDAVVEENRWRYVVCGVSIPKQEMYLTNLIESNYRSMTISNIPTSISISKLTISENSPTNFGVTYVKELRLWSCYDCSTDRAFVNFNKDDTFFSNVIHYFKFEDPNGLLKDYHSNTKTGDESISVQFETKTDFNGYGLLNEIPDIPNCNEGGNMYYNINKEKGCDIMFNFNIFKNDITFPNIPSSTGNRYTIDFWFYVESPNDFTDGFNFIYSNHMTISSYSQNIHQTDLTVYCFPQAYRDKLKDQFGDNILNKYNQAQNKDKETFTNGYSKWHYIKCAYNFDTQKYYLNDNAEKNIISEIFYTKADNNKIQNSKSFKYFMKNTNDFIINISRNNKVRIFIQTINIYREYIPKQINTKYINMVKYIASTTNNYYYPLLFSVNFPKDYNVIKNYLYYHVSDYNSIYNPEDTYIPNFLTNIRNLTYTSYPLYDEFVLCDIGKKLNTIDNKCIYITTDNTYTCDNKNYFCLDDNKFFWCKKGYYLNINDLTCNVDCPVGFTRPSDIINGYGFCSINANDMHYQTYPYLNEDLQQGTYENKFTCENGYTLANYFCLPTSNNNLLYFNSKYYFYNMIADYSSLKLDEYFVDFWFMLDLSEFNRFNNDDNNRYTIFIAYPHFITRYKTYIQYNNAFQTLDFYNITTLEEIKLKWNRIVIENYNNVNDLNTKNIKIYLNNNFHTPIFNLTVSTSYDYSLSQIAFCHKVNNEYNKCILGLNSSYYTVYQPEWEDAMYKNIIVWNRKSTSIISINTFGTEINKELTMNIISYHTFNYNTISTKYVKSLLEYNNKYFNFVIKYNTENEYDHSQKINWINNNYDITLPNNYIYSINNEGYNDNSIPYFSLNSNSYTINNCLGNCYQCFNGSNSQCISCKNNYLLSNSECVQFNKYYFKTPMDNKNTVSNIIFNYDFSVKNCISFSVYIKFLGSVDVRSGIVPILYFYDTNNYLGYDIDNNNFIININNDDYSNIILYKYENSRSSIGRWALYSISIYKTAYQNIFPNMFIFMIDNIIIPINKNINLNTLNLLQVKFNKISISNIVSALYYDLRIYNNFIVGLYGYSQNPYSGNNGYGYDNKVKEYLLSSTTNNFQCLSSSSVIGPVLSTTTDYCIGDENLYDNSNTYCDNINNKYRYINDIAHTYSCYECNNVCYNTICFNTNEKSCTCSIDNINYWLGYNNKAFIDTEDENNSINMFYCQEINSLNLNKYNSIELNNIKLGSSDGYQIEMWIYVYSYINNENFGGVEITWKNFIKIDINYNNINTDFLIIKCYPYSENTNYVVNVNNTYKFNEWIFIKCVVDLENKKISLNDIKSTTISSLNWNIQSSGTTTLNLKENSSGPFGVFLLRELRLFNTKTNLLYSTEHLNLAVDGTYENLIHYYKNIYHVNENKNYIYDYITKSNTYITTSNPNYIYSYINLPDLVLCEEGQSYKLNTITNLYTCGETTTSDILNNLKDDNTSFNPNELISLADSLYNLTIGEYSYTIPSIYTTISKTEDNNNFTFTDPSTSTAYCSNRGYIRVIDHMLVCYCYSDYIGKYCQLDYSDYTNLNNIFTLFLNKAINTYNNYINNNDNTNDNSELDNILDSLIYIAKSNENFMVDNELLTTFTNFLEDSIIYSVNQCNEKYIKLVDTLYGSVILLINNYKLSTIINTDSNARNVALTSSQKDNVKSTIISLKKMLEYLTKLCFHYTENYYYNYKSDNLNVDLLQYPTSGNFDLDNLIKSKKYNEYAPYIEVNNCLNSIKNSISGNIINIQYITWYFPPYYYEYNLYSNYTGHYTELKFYDNELNEISVSKCEKDNEIKFYFSLYNTDFINIINSNKKHFYSENMFKSTDPIFTEPKYIEKDGTVNTMSREERITKYYFEYILTFNYLDEKELKYIQDEEALNYLTINEEDNYFICSSNHLSDFLLNYEYNEYPNKEDGRLYFFKHFNIYKNAKNWKKNYGIFLIIGIIVIFALNFLVCFYVMKNKINKIGKEKLIENFLEEYVYPYGNPLPDYFVNKENLNKIIDENDNNNDNNDNNNNDIDDDEINITGNKEKEKKLTINKKKGNKKKKIKNKKFDNKKINIDINVGNIKNKEIYNNYFENLQAEPIDNLDFDFNNNNNIISSNKNIDNNNTKINTNANNSIIKKTTNYKNSQTINSIDYSSDENIKSRKIKEKINIYKKNNYISDKNKDEYKFTEKEIKDFSNYRHNLLIYNKDQRCHYYKTLKINCFKFLLTNIFNRNLFINTFRPNITYSTLFKSLYLSMYLIIILFTSTFLWLYEKEEINFNEYKKKHLIKFIFYTLIPFALANGFFYLKSCIYIIYGVDIRLMLYNIKTHHNNEFEKKYNKVIKFNKIFNFIELGLFISLIIITLLFTFGLCAIYTKQAKLMILSIGFGLGIDFGLGIIFEIILGLLFCCRKNYIIVSILDFLNRFRSFKMLSP